MVVGLLGNLNSLIEQNDIQALQSSLYGISYLDDTFIRYKWIELAVLTTFVVRLGWDWFNCDSQAPKLYLAVLWVIVVSVNINMILIRYTPLAILNPDKFDMVMDGFIIEALLSLIIVIAFTFYFKKSKQVRETFIN
jgi:hypothetical protein